MIKDDKEIKTTEEIKIHVFGKDIYSSTVVIGLSWFTGVFIVAGLISFQGLMSYFKYFDLVELNWFWDWVLRKDPLNFPMDILITFLQIMTVIFSGLEVSTNIFSNIESLNGQKIDLTPRQARQLLSLVFMWFIMMLIIVLSKVFLGTRGVEYYEKNIFVGFGGSLVIFATGIVSPSFANKFRGRKDKENDRIQEAKEFAKAAKEFADSNNDNISHNNTNTDPEHKGGENNG